MLYSCQLDEKWEKMESCIRRESWHRHTPNESLSPARKCPLQDPSGMILWQTARSAADRDVVRLKVENLWLMISCNSEMVACNWRWHRVDSLLLPHSFFFRFRSLWLLNEKCKMWEVFCARSSFSVCVPCRQTIIFTVKSTKISILLFCAAVLVLRKATFIWGVYALSPLYVIIIINKRNHKMRAKKASKTFSLN